MLVAAASAVGSAVLVKNSIPDWSHTNGRPRHMYTESM